MKKPLLVALVTVAIILILETSGVIALGSIARRLVRPATKPLTTIGQYFNSAIREARELGSLSVRSRELEVANRELEQQLADYKNLQDENRQLRDQLQLPPVKKQTMTARVISFQPDGVRQWLRIDRGSADGVEPGTVVVYGHYLVGIIKAVDTHTASVLLRNDPDFRALVRSQDSTATGVLVGRGSSSAVEKIPQNQVIAAEHSIITSGMDGEYPYGLLVGRVSAVAQESDGIFQTAQIFSPVDLQTLRIVTLLYD